MAEIFKAYDIRGVYPTDLDEDKAYKIGKAFVQFLKCNKVVVGYDMRNSSPKIFEALTKGLISQGANVIDIGLCSTPISYFANSYLEADASIMITASHNPAEYNGFKLSRENAIPISEKTGIKEIKKLVEENIFIDSELEGKVLKDEEVKKEYFKKMISFYNKSDKNIKVVCDYANAVGTIETQPLKEIVEVIPLYEELDGYMPNHEANPLDTHTLKDLQRKVIEEKASFGISFDGDADRAGFVDENGNIVPMDLTTALIAKDILEKNDGATILYDLRSSKAVKEIIEENGGKAIKCSVGHTFIKAQMREYGAIFAGELSGHYYFKDNSTTESTLLACIHLINLVNEKGKLSKQISEIKRYDQSGEINFKVESASNIIRRIENHYFDGKKDYLDGVTIEYDNWWFNLRASNTEPLLRLNVEANNDELLVKKIEELTKLIGE